MGEEGEGPRGPLLCEQHRSELLARAKTLRQCQQALLAQPHAAYFGVSVHGVGRQPRAPADARSPEQAAHHTRGEPPAAALAAGGAPRSAGNTPCSGPPPSAIRPAPDHPRAAASPDETTAAAPAAAATQAGACGADAPPAREQAPASRSPLGSAQALLATGAHGARPAVPCALSIGVVTDEARCTRERSAESIERGEAPEAAQPLELPAEQPLLPPGCAPLCVSSCASGLVLAAYEGWLDVYAPQAPAPAPPGGCPERRWQHAARISVGGGAQLPAAVVAASVRCGGARADGEWQARVAVVFGARPSAPAGCPPPPLSLDGEAHGACAARISVHTLALRLAAGSAERGSGGLACGQACVCSEALSLQPGEPPLSAHVRAPSTPPAALPACSVREVHSLPGERALLALSGGRAALWAVAAPAPPRSARRAGLPAPSSQTKLIANVRLLPAPLWAACGCAHAAGAIEQGGERPHGLAGGGPGSGCWCCELALQLLPWSDELAVGACAHGLALWSLGRRTLLLCYGLRAAHPQPACALTSARCPPPRGVVCAAYASRCAAELEQLTRNAALAAAGTAHRTAAAGQHDAEAAAVVALLLVALRPCEAASANAEPPAGARAGFWSCLSRGAGGAERGGAPGSPRASGSGAGAPVAKDLARVFSVHLLALSSSELCSVREYAPPPSLLSAVRGGEARSAAERAPPGWDTISASAGSVAALSRAARAVCVWDAASCACVAAVRLQNSAPVRHLFMLQEVCCSAWVLWHVRHDSEVATPESAPLALAGRAPAPADGSAGSLLGKRVRPHHAPLARQPLAMRQPAALTGPLPAPKAGAHTPPSHALGWAGGFAPPTPTGEAPGGLMGFRTGAGKPVGVALSAAALERANRLLLEDDDE